MIAVRVGVKAVLFVLLQESGIEDLGPVPIHARMVMTGAD